MSAKNNKVCCNCRHNIRTSDGECHCDIDGHYIGYIDCFEHWCRRWARDKKFDNAHIEEGDER